MPAARSLYEQYAPDPRQEIGNVISDDCFWRLPHIVNRAHLHADAGDARGRADLEQLLVELERISSQGVVHNDTMYWAASAHALLGRHEPRCSSSTTRSATAGGAWWARHDCSMHCLAADPAMAAARAR
jgi:hypothetical protein